MVERDTEAAHFDILRRLHPFVGSLSLFERENRISCSCVAHELSHADVLIAESVQRCGPPAPCLTLMRFEPNASPRLNTGSRASVPGCLKCQNRQTCCASVAHIGAAGRLKKLKIPRLNATCLSSDESDHPPSERCSWRFSRLAQSAGFVRRPASGSTPIRHRVG